MICLIFGKDGKRIEIYTLMIIKKFINKNYICQINDFQCIMNYSFIFLLISFLIAFVSCKKEVPTITDDLGNQIILESENYNQLEIISVETTSLSISSGTYFGMVGNDSVSIVISDGILSFIAAVQPQSNVKLKFKANGVDFESTSFNVIDLQVINTPDEVFDQFLNLQVSINNLTTLLIDSMSNYPATFNPNTYLDDQNILNNHRNSLIQDYQSLSLEEKLYVAKFIKANEHLFQDCVDALYSFDDVIPPYLPKSLDIDLEQMNVDRATNLMNAWKKAARLIGIAVGSGIVVSGITLTPIAGIVTAGIILGWNGNVFQNLVAQYDIFNKSALSIIMDNLTMNKVNISFEENTLHSLEIKSEYRSINNQTDFSSFFMKSLKETLDLIYINYSRISSYFSFSTPVIPVGNMTNYKTFNLDVHANYLTISEISNSNVELVSQSNNNGTLDVVFSNNQPGVAQDFTFKLSYNSAFGQASEVIDATLGLEPLNWVTLPYTHFPGGGDECSGMLAYEFTGGIPHYTMKFFSNGTLLRTEEYIPTSSSIWNIYELFCVGQSYTIEVHDQDGTFISHDITF